MTLPFVDLARRVEREVRTTVTDAAGRTALAVLDGILQSPYMDEAIDRVLSSRATDRAVDRVFDGPELDKILDRLLASEELWLLVDEIARSPSVTSAITQQSTTFADQIVGEIRTRSQHADDRLEGIARRALRRKPAAEPEA